MTDSSADEEINITLNRSTLEMLRNLSKEITESENKQLRRAENRQAKLNGEKPKYPRKNAKKAGKRPIRILTHSRTQNNLLLAKCWFCQSH